MAGTAGRSSCRGGGNEATAVSSPPASRTCVVRVWRALEQMKRVPDECKRGRLVRKMQHVPSRGYVTDPHPNYYALLEWLGGQWPGKTLVELGTYFGASAASLSASCKSPIISVDCMDYLDNSLRKLPGVTFVVEDALDWLETNTELIQECPLVFLDVSHDGWTEGQIVAALDAAGFQGILLLDDIHLNEPMRRFWQSITRPKLDLTAIGHHSGTGAVLFERSES